MQYVMGIDGGATKTLLKIADLSGNLLAVCEGGAINLNSMENSRVEENLRKLLIEGTAKIYESMSECLAVCIGAAGAGREREVKQIERLVRNTGFKGSLTVTDDARTALYGAVGGGEGIIIISGTGSICFGRNNDRECHRTGGWGHIIGDEGSGYYIGREILKHIMRSYDGREASTMLTAFILEYLGIDSVDGLIEYVYGRDMDKKQLAALAKFADEACRLGDEAAERILKAAAFELYLCAKAVIDKLKFDKRISAALSGSVFAKSEYVRTEFCRLLKGSYPFVDIVPVGNDAAWGAVLIALDSLRTIK